MNETIEKVVNSDVVEEVVGVRGEGEFEQRFRL